MPWRVLLPGGGLETRAFTTTGENDGPEAQRPILQRLFGPGVSWRRWGCGLIAVPVGRTEWPLITSGVAPAQAKETVAAADAVAVGFKFANLKPKRLTGAYEYTHEEAASSVPGIEQALRRDLADAVAVEDGRADRPRGGPDKCGPAERRGVHHETNRGRTWQPGLRTAADYGRLHALAVDGIHAGNRVGRLCRVIGTATYTHAAGVYITGSGESGSELLARRSAGCMASTYLPADSVEEAVGNPARRRAEWWRDHARRFGGRYVAHPRIDPGYLLQGLPGCRADVGNSVGRCGCVPVGRLQAGRYPDQAVGVSRIGGRGLWP